jgi:flavorubredoxin
VDERTTRFAAGRAGSATHNTYLLKHRDAALIVDTGLTVHRQGILDGLAARLDERLRLAILHTRLGEYESICNTSAIVNTFHVDAMYGNQISHQWADFEASMRRDRRPESLRLSAEQELPIGDAPARTLDVFLPDMRVLPTFWAFDRQARVLFTSDFFSYVIQDGEETAPITRSRAGIPETGVIAEHLLQGRYWWLAHVDPAPLCDWLHGVFDRFDVHTIAPAYGAVISGRDVVREHVEAVTRAVHESGGRAVA